jgi:ribosomal protein S18 acetylase RimI-like enzyme
MLIPKNWTVAESNNRLVGAFFGFLLEDPYPEINYSEIPECIHPLIELRKYAAGAWLLQAISVLPEARNKGISKKLLKEVESAVKSMGTSQIVLQVQEDNKVAVHTYKKSGYVELDRKPFVSFLGSDDSGDYLLMGKNL